ncbi:MAG TPA: outer membrane lipoprotein carrier protein LolA [Longimicrobiales bacterium]
MRRIGIGAGILLVTLLIALAVRGQVRRTSPAQAAPVPAADTPSVPTPAVPDTIITGTDVVPRPLPAPAQDSTPGRPVISDKVPTVVTPESDTATSAAQAGANVLKRAAAAYSKTRSMRADFVQRRENPLLNSTTVSRGTLYQRDPDRFALKFSQPAGDVIIGDGRYFWLYYPSVDRKQVIRAPAGTGAGAVDLQSQFIGDPLTRFTHVYHGTQQLSGRTLHVLTLTPRRDMGYKTLTVWVDGADYLVRKFQITEPSGSLVEFELNKLAANPSLGDDIFRFTPPAGAKIIDR